MKVSVIVPVYNVEDCLNRCINSLVKQTFSDMEILLIDDGSMDSSYRICCEWAETYKNILVFQKKNEGLGATRNYGVQYSTGEYIMYVDSDDWVDTSIVEKLYTKISFYQAEIAICDRYNYSSMKNTYEYVRNNLKNELVYSSSEKQVIFDISNVAWAKLYKKSLLTEYDIKQPTCKFEDVITPVMLALAEKICYIPEALYYYWIDRKKSITNDLTFTRDVDYLYVLIEEFKKRNLYEAFQTQIEEIAKFRIAWNTQRALCLINKNKEKLENQYIRYKEMNEKFLLEQNIDMPLEFLDNICVIGSYNLMIAAKIIAGIPAENNLEKHFSFSNVISMMSSTEEDFLNIEICGENNYRKRHVINDLSKTFRNMHASWLEQCGIILIDLLEDRFEVCRYHDSYFTVSDAQVECAGVLQKHKSNLGMHEDAYWSVWYSKCDELIALLKARYSKKTIVLVKLKLTETYGTYQKREYFKDLDSIRFINECMEKEYSYFIDNFKEVFVINIDKDDFLYTDESFRHGCVPWHMNADMYKIIGKKILETVNDEK